MITVNTENSDGSGKHLNTMAATAAKATDVFYMVADCSKISTDFGDALHSGTNDLPMFNVLRFLISTNRNNGQFE